MERTIDEIVRGANPDLGGSECAERDMLWLILDRLFQLIAFNKLSVTHAKKKGKGT
jgi:hypothetical protein